MDALDNEDYSRATCDTCGISVCARVVIALATGGVLCYCFHHANKYRSALEEQGALIVPLSTV